MIKGLKGFKPICKLGEGAFGVVYRVLRLEDNKEYALKQIHMTKLSEKEKANALNEIRILASVKHPNIVGYRDAFFDEDSQTLNIVMDFAAKGDLSSLIESHKKSQQYISETEIWRVLVQVCRALKCLHSENIVHRDLKGANIFISESGDYLIGDLNISKVIKSGFAETQIGTPYYASPEIWQDVPYDEKSDMWSLGCVLYEMAALEPPFKGKDMGALSRKVRTGVYSKIPEFYSKDLSAVIGSLLKVSCNLRPSSSELLEDKVVMKHYSSKVDPWVFKNQATMLETINFNEHDINKMNEQLPKSNYSSNPRVISFRQRIHTLQSEKNCENLLGRIERIESSKEKQKERQKEKERDRQYELQKSRQKHKYAQESPQRIDHSPYLRKDNIIEARVPDRLGKLPPKPNINISNRVEKREKSFVAPQSQRQRSGDSHDYIYKEYLASRDRRSSNESTNSQRRYIVPRRSLSKHC